MTIQTPELLTEHEARRLTERIRTALDRVSTAWSDLSERITEAWERRADLALGYDSWAEYAEAELRPPSQIAAEVRRELVGLLSARGMSTRAIAPTVGVSHAQIAVDRQVSSDLTPVRNRTPDPGPTVYDLHDPSFERIDLTTGEVLDAAPETSATTGGGEAPVVAEPRKVVGLDGKQYTRPAPSAPARRPLRDGFRDAALDLDKIIGRFERLIADDRYPRNRDEVARYANDLTRARDALDRLVGQMSNT